MGRLAPGLVVTFEFGGDRGLYKSLILTYTIINNSDVVMFFYCRINKNLKYSINSIRVLFWVPEPELKFRIIKKLSAWKNPFPNSYCRKSRVPDYQVPDKRDLTVYIVFDNFTEIESRHCRCQDLGLWPFLFCVGPIRPTPSHIILVYQCDKLLHGQMERNLFGLALMRVED